jgi:hypothetical protein
MLANNLGEAVRLYNNERYCKQAYSPERSGRVEPKLIVLGWVVYRLDTVLVVYDPPSAGSGRVADDVGKSPTVVTPDNILGEKDPLLGLDNKVRKLHP